MPAPSLSRITRAYVSGYNRSSVHVASVRRQEKRMVTADFKGLLNGSDPIASVKWQCNAPWVLAMSNAAIDGQTVTVTASFQYPGYSGLKATITTDSGSQYSQQFDFTVRDQPIFTDEEQLSAGPFSLSATVS